MKHHHNRLFIMLFATLLLLTTACKSSRHSTESGGAHEYSGDNQRYTAVVSQYNDWKTISASGRMQISMGQSFSSNVQVKMIKNKSISISLRPLLGIEMARIFLTSDSIYIVDKYHKMYLAEKITELTQGFPVEVGAVQNILINRAFLIGKGEISQKNIKALTIKENTNSTWEILPKNQLSDFIYSFIFNSNNQLTTLSVSPQNVESPFAITYSDFNNSELGNIATSISVISIVNDKKLSLDVNIDASKIRLNNTFEDGIDINPNYKRIQASAIPLILKNL